MPKMNGIEATKVIRKVSPGTKILILSMHDSANFAKEAKLAGAHGFLTKACPVAELRSVIAEVCRGFDRQAREMDAATGEPNEARFSDKRADGSTLPSKSSIATMASLTAMNLSLTQMEAWKFRRKCLRSKDMQKNGSLLWSQKSRAVRFRHIGCG